MDGLACFEYTSGSQIDRTRKDFTKTFDLSLDWETNLKAANFLDVTLNFKRCNKRS